MSPELSAILFAVAVPIVVQALKLLAAKIGKPLDTWILQVVAGALSAGFVYFSGGFAGLVLPVFAGDPLAFASALIGLGYVAWGAVELTYRLVLKRLMEGVQALLS